jgi:hypothetical protein
VKLFISWSGKVSQEIAKEFRDWLPLLNKDIKPYMSAEDIEKGAHWSSRIRSELAETRFGILILTKENVTSPWLHFEAGAIAKSVDDSRMVPILFGLTEPEIDQPLSLFQASRFEKEEIWKVVQGANSIAGAEAASETILKRLFDKFWPDLFEKVGVHIRSLAKPDGSTLDPKEESEKIVRELLMLSRQQMHILSNPQDLFGTELLSLLVRLVRDDESASIKLAADERRLGQALVARIKSQQTEFKKLIGELPKDRREEATALVNRVLKYVDEFQKMLAGTIGA